MSKLSKHEIKLHNEAFTLFGKPFQVTERTDTRTVYFVKFALFAVSITELTNGEVWVQTSESAMLNRADSKEAARDAAEIELRRIMRECFEIAGAMEASSCELLEPARVRFREE
jgi:hypothetical protein